VKWNKLKVRGTNRRNRGRTGFGGMEVQEGITGSKVLRENEKKISNLKMGTNVAREQYYFMMIGSFIPVVTLLLQIAVLRRKSWIMRCLNIVQYEYSIEECTVHRKMSVRVSENVNESRKHDLTSINYFTMARSALCQRKLAHIPHCQKEV
jgi:hypothetical protein